MRSSAEIKVGLAAAAALVVLGAIVYYLIGLYGARMGYPLEAEFERAEVRAGDNVVMAGVSVGRVESVALTRQSRALVRMRIRPGVVVREGYTIHIVPGALLGEKFVEIRPGPNRAARPLRPGARMKGEPYVRVEDLVADAQGLLGRLNQAAEAVTRLTQDQRMRARLEQSMTNLGQAASEMAQLARQLRAMAAETRPQVRQVLRNIEAVTRDVRVTTQTLSRTVTESAIPQELEESARLLRSVMERVDDIAAQLQEMATDPEMRELAQAALRDVRATAQSIRQASEEIRVAAANARTASGTVEQASRDLPQITANVREASANVRDAAAEIKEAAKEARSALPEVTERATKVVEAIPELPPVRAGLNVGAQYLMRRDRWWVDANLDLTSQERLLRLGVADLGETNRFNLQLGQPFGGGRIRYGVVESEVGLGYDWAAAPWLTLSAEIFDPNDVRANLFGYWALGDTLRGWDAALGYRGIGERGSLAVGVRVKR